MQEKQDREPFGQHPLPRRVRSAARRSEARRARPPCRPCLPRSRATGSASPNGCSTRTNPLTARVTVNRFWQEIFGTGLVQNGGGLRLAGRAPSHPELLDWLAVEFRESGWDVKQLFRADGHVARPTASRPRLTPEKLEKDPDNRLLSRGPRFRMDAEMVRDYALAASGLLVDKIGGPSVKPYQPDGVWEAVAMLGSNTRFYKQDTGEKLYRRSLYTFWKRSAPRRLDGDLQRAHPRDLHGPPRAHQHAAQALVTLNDPQFVEAARALAELRMQDGGTDLRRDVSISWPTRVLARPLRRERARNRQAALAASCSTYYESQPGRRARLIVRRRVEARSDTDPAADSRPGRCWPTRC